MAAHPLPRNLFYWLKFYMWFKNLQVYRFTKPFTISPEDLADKLSEREFQPCGSQDLSQYGWVPPLGHNGSDYVHAANGFVMLCAKKQEKLLPASVINEQVSEKIIRIQEDEGRAVGRKERLTLKEDTAFELMPRALVRSNLQYAYIAPQQGLLVVNAASTKRAEELLSYLRDTIGSVPVIPLMANNLPQQVMTQWVNTGELPRSFEFGHECELRDPSDEQAIIRCKHQDLSSVDIRNHITAGMYVSKLGMSWNESINFIVDDNLTIKRLQFSEIVQEKANQANADDAAQQFDQDFAVMTLELSALIAAVVAAFGGENTDSADTE